MKSPYIVDASFILQALLGEKPAARKQFLKIFESIETEKTLIMAPDFLKLEIRNGLRFSVKDAQLVQEVIENFTALPIHYLALTELHLQEALRLSWQHQTSVYDSLYHVLALAQQGTLITCDQKYYRAAQKLGAITLVAT